MKIAIFTHNYPLGPHDRQNAGIFVADIAQALKQDKHQVFVLSPHPGQPTKVGNIPVTWFDWAGKGQKAGGLKLFSPKDLYYSFNLLVSGSRAASRLCREQEIDFVIGMWAFPAGVFAWWTRVRLGIPYGLWALGSDIYVYARYPIIGNIIKTSLKKASFLLADGIDLSRVTARLAGKKCHFLPSASNLPHPSVELKSKKGPIRFVYLGRMEPVKGPDLLIDAVCRLKDLDFELHLMGDGSLLPILKKQVTQEKIGKKVTFYGNVSDPKKIYKVLAQSDWLVIPSRSDSIPLVFSEGLKASLPLITAEVGDMAELVRDHKVGWSFPKEDTVKLTNLLKKAINLGREETRKFQPPITALAKIFDVHSSAQKLSQMIQKSGNF